MTRVTGSLAAYPARIGFVYYAVLIALGTTALMHPWCRAPGAAPIRPLDAVFTATSASCVTGLAVRSTAHDFSPIGQAVILLLFQVGGIGIMTVSTYILFSFGRSENLRARRVMSETLGATDDMDLRRLLRSVLLTTALFEGVGFALLAGRNLLIAPPRQAIWDALFHSVSAFCNAGFALHDDSLTRYRDDVWVNVVISGLVISGGIGFPVLMDLRRNLHRDWPDLWRHLHLNTKVMLLGTGFLLAFGAVATFLLERDEPAMDDLSLGEQILAAAFHSVSTRTAGFNTLEIGELSPPTLLLTIILMMIGAGACSTAGGLKVSTAMILIFQAWARFFGRDHVNVFRRSIPDDTVTRATATLTIFVTIFVAALVALMVAERGQLSELPLRQISQTRSSDLAESEVEGPDRPRETDRVPSPDRTLPEGMSDSTTSEVVARLQFTDLTFEVASALGTVGLSTGITAQLSPLGQVIIVLLMFFGRLGPITVFAALARTERTGGISYPFEEPLTG